MIPDPLLSVVHTKQNQIIQQVARQGLQTNTLFTIHVGLAKSGAFYPINLCLGERWKESGYLHILLQVGLFLCAL